MLLTSKERGQREIGNLIYTPWGVSTIALSVDW
jgi:hypothetical protein